MKKSLLLGVAALVASALTLNAADQPLNPNAAPGEQKVVMKPVFKSSTLVGMKVKNSKNETVGSIDDLVIDPQHGNIRYAALAVGGFLGIGDKLFAVPWESLTLKVDEKDTYFFLDVDKERMKAAHSFPKDRWPDFGDVKFGEEIDRFYGVHRVARQPVEHTPAPATPKRQ